MKYKLSGYEFQTKKEIISLVKTIMFKDLKNELTDEKEIQFMIDLISGYHHSENIRNVSDTFHCKKIPKFKQEVGLWVILPNDYPVNISYTKLIDRFVNGLNKPDIFIIKNVDDEINFKFTFGKYKDKTIEEVYSIDIPYLNWVLDSEINNDLKDKIKKYIKTNSLPLVEELNKEFDTELKELIFNWNWEVNGRLTNQKIMEHFNIEEEYLRKYIKKYREYIDNEFLNYKTRKKI